VGLHPERRRSIGPESLGELEGDRGCGALRHDGVDRSFGPVAQDTEPGGVVVYGDHEGLGGLPLFRYRGDPHDHQDDEKGKSGDPEETGKGHRRLSG
jgi:hypothetical protein